MQNPMAAPILVKDLSKCFNDTNFNKAYEDRFKRILRFFEYDATEANVCEFLALILDNPDAFKQTSRITQKWKAPKSVHDVFSSIVSVCNIPSVAESLGPRQKQVIEAHEQYIKELVSLNQQIPAKAALPPPPQPPLEHADGCSVPGSVKASTDSLSEFHGEVEWQQGIDDPKPQSCMNRRRLKFYVHHLRNIDHPIVNAYMNTLEDELECSPISRRRLKFYISHLRGTDDPTVNAYMNTLEDELEYGY